MFEPANIERVTVRLDVWTKNNRHVGIDYTLLPEHLFNLAYSPTETLKTITAILWHKIVSSVT